MDRLTQIQNINTDHEWRQFFVDHPELCDAAPSDSAGKYLVRIQGFCVNYAAVRALLSEEETEALSEAAYRVGNAAYCVDLLETEQDQTEGVT